MSEQRPVFGGPEVLEKAIILGETVDCIKCPQCHKLFGLEHYQFYQNDSYRLHGDPGYLYGVVSGHEQHVYSCPHCKAHNDNEKPFYCPVMESKIYDQCDGCKLTDADLICQCPIRNSKRYYEDDEFEFISHEYCGKRENWVTLHIHPSSPAPAPDRTELAKENDNE